MYKQSGWMKSKALLASLLLVVGVTVGGTLAYIVADSGSVENTFTPSKVTTEVVEGFVDNTKKDVFYIKNTGDTTAYIRAAVVVTWQDEQGNVYGQKPVAGTDYTISYDLNNGWVQGADGFYYWTSPVLSDDENAENCCTGVLIESCTAADEKSAPEGYSLAVEIIGSGIQNKPADAFESAWASSGLKVNYSDADPMRWTLVKKEGDAQ